MFTKNKKPFMEYMNETKLINRWTALRIGMFGTFLGVCLAIVYSMLAMV